MPYISLYVTDAEKIWMESYTHLHHVNLSKAIKDAFFEKLEEEYDIKTINEYEMRKDEKLFSHEEVMNILGIK